MTTESERITELEIRMEHQDKLIADLNDVITDQWKKLDMLERQLKRLGEDIESLQPAEATGNQKPPHY